MNPANLTDKKKRALKYTLLLVALTNMISVALSPATEQIRQHFGVELATVQTAMSATNVLQICVSLIAMYLINRGLLTKKRAIVIGQSLFALAVIFVLLCHHAFWCVYVLSALVGTALGLFVTNAFGIIFDCFEPDERQSLTGLQTSCISLGGIICSLTGGLLAGLFWYGGYLVLSVGVVIAVVAAVNIPNYKSPKAAEGGKRSPIKPKVFFYAVSAFVFMLCYVTVSQNISSHLARHFEHFSRLAGICSAVQMGGGVVSGLLFKKISGKLQDDTLVLALCILAAGLLVLSFLTTSLVLILISVFCCGLTLSLFTPWCIFGVSVNSDPTNSAVTSVIISAIAPSTGGFLSPVVFTNITNAIVPGATDFRYRFVAACAFAVAIILFIRNRLAKDGAKPV